MDTFRFNGKEYQMCDNGTFQIQTGPLYTNARERFKYKTTYRLEGVLSLGVMLANYSRLWLPTGWAKRLSYNVSRNAPYKQLHRTIYE